jgi:DNA-binding response OmpR family regulator
LKKALIVDDDPNICELLRLYFEKDGFVVSTVGDGPSALRAFRDSPSDIVLLDLMLPGMDGFDVCREIRKESQVPIIMLTARGETLDKVVGLELGSDDYVQKPFEPKELMARVKAVLRRSAATTAQLNPNDGHQPGDDPTIDLPGLRVDKVRFQVLLDGKTLEMPPKELELLYHLASHPDRVFTREQLLASVWGYDFFGESRTVDVHVKRIREKLEANGPRESWRIRTVWGVGYKFETS